MFELPHIQYQCGDCVTYFESEFCNGKAARVVGACIGSDSFDVELANGERINNVQAKDLQLVEE